MIVDHYLDERIRKCGYLLLKTQTWAEQSLGKYKLVGQNHQDRKIFFQSLFGVHQYIQELEQDKIGAKQEVYY